MSSEFEIDVVMLADRAEVLNGKLYMMGGGWDAIGASTSEQPSHFTVVLAFLVPWNATNMEHACTVRLENADGAGMLNLSYSIRTGRPPSLPDGATQRVMLCLPITAAFPIPGMYAVVVAVGAREKRVAFHVHAVAPLAPGSQLPN
jgi:hypothetical protein